jgi:hypothetical protein
MICAPHLSPIYPTPRLDISENGPCSEIIPLLSKDDSYFDIHIFSITGQYSNRMLRIHVFPVLPRVPFLSKALLFPGWDYSTIAQSRGLHGINVFRTKRWYQPSRRSVQPFPQLQSTFASKTTLRMAFVPTDSLATWRYFAPTPLEYKCPQNEKTHHGNLTRNPSINADPLNQC